MPQGEDSLDDLDAQLAELRRRTEAGFAERADALEAAAERARRGDPDAREEVRRLAHRIRGVAIGQPRLAALMQQVENAAAQGEPIDVSAAVAHARAIAAAARQPLAGATEAHPASASKPPRARVLVVDDDEAIRRMMRLSLERLGGFEVVTAATGDEALAAMQAQPFDLILLDAMMPTTTGLELCVQARALDRQAGAKIVILSAATPDELGPAAPDGWWRKPMPMREVLDRVRALLADRGP